MARSNASAGATPISASVRAIGRSTASRPVQAFDLCLEARSGERSFWIVKHLLTERRVLSYAIENPLADSPELLLD
jgi:hypothetical protein